MVKVEKGTLYIRVLLATTDLVEHASAVHTEQQERERTQNDIYVPAKNARAHN